MDQCSGCRFWKRLEIGETFEVDSCLASDEEDGVFFAGWCKRFPPVVSDVLLKSQESLPVHKGVEYCGTPLTMISGASVHPITWQFDWCGEYEKRTELNDGQESDQSYHQENNG